MENIEEIGRAEAGKRPRITSGGSMMLELIEVGLPPDHVLSAEMDGG